MNEKIDWMLGMSQNMLNISEENKDRPMVGELYQLNSVLLQNLERMKEKEGLDNVIDNMEPIMRALEQVMIHMDMDDENQKTAMRHMLTYMQFLQSQYI